MKPFISFLFMIAGLSLSLSAQKVVVTTTVQNYTVTNIMLGCPSYDGDPALVVGYDKLTGSDKDFERLEELITSFETENGAQIKSQSNVRNSVTTKDEVSSTTKGDLSGSGKRLCDHIKKMMP